jgi:hypothetical protein
VFTGTGTGTKKYTHGLPVSHPSDDATMKNGRMNGTATTNGGGDGMTTKNSMAMTYSRGDDMTTKNGGDNNMTTMNRGDDTCNNQHPHYKHEMVGSFFYLFFAFCLIFFFYSWNDPSPL